MNRTWLHKIAVFGLVSALAPGSAAFAQNVVPQNGTDVMEAMTATVARKLAAPREQSASDQDRFKVVTLPTLQPASQQTGLQTRSKRGSKVAYGILLGIAGMYGGAFIGSRFGQDCRCDDPGLEGGVWGALIGAIGGAWFGTWLGGR